MKRWQDWATALTNDSTREPTVNPTVWGRGSLLGAILRYRLLTVNPVTEAECDGVPFTPIWWWWNRDADEYIMTLWDTEAGKDEPPMYSFGASDPAGTWGKPTTFIVPPSYRKAIRKLLDNK